MRTTISIFLASLALVCGRAESADQTKQKFEQYYTQWLSECDQPKVRIMSDAHVFTSLPSYRAIVALGRPALPYLRQKMEDNTGFNFMLVYAAIEIEGWKVSDFDSTGVQEIRDKVLERMKSEK
jgi:hypothetical protein